MSKCGSNEPSSPEAVRQESHKGNQFITRNGTPHICFQLKATSPKLIKFKRRKILQELFPRGFVFIDHVGANNVPTKMGSANDVGMIKMCTKQLQKEWGGWGWKEKKSPR